VRKRRVIIGGPFTPASLDKLQPLRVSERFYEALNQLVQGNPAPMFEVWSHAPDVSTMHSLGGREIGWEQVQQGWEQASQGLARGKAEIGRITVVDLVLVPLDEGQAYTLGTEHVDVTVGGRHVSFQGRVTNVYRREDGEWKMIHRHVDLLSPEVLSGLMGRSQRSAVSYQR
jgi:ketosteroid isomerase-like protein